MSGNTKWKNSPLKEVVFDLRFKPVSDYSLFAGGIFNDIQSYFPNNLKINLPSLPEQILISGQVRHRFSSKDNSSFFQTGNDTISINVVEYNGFDEFSNLVRISLENAFKHIDISSINRMSLRYINKFKAEENIFSVLNIEPPFSDFNSSENMYFSLKDVTRVSDELYLSKSILSQSSQLGGPNDIFFDLTVFYEIPSSFNSLSHQYIIDWIHKSHKLIWTKFDSLVSDLEKEKRK